MASTISLVKSNGVGGSRLWEEPNVLINGHVIKLPSKHLFVPIHWYLLGLGHRVLK